MSDATRLAKLNRTRRVSKTYLQQTLAIKHIFQIKPVDSEEIILKATVSVPDKAIQSNTITDKCYKSAEGKSLNGELGSELFTYHSAILKKMDHSFQKALLEEFRIKQAILLGKPELHITNKTYFYKKDRKC